MGVTRRLAFSAPFVVIAACERPVEHHHHAKRSRRPPVDALVVDAPPEAPDELVAELKPLSKDKTAEDECRHAFCNPPPPWPPSREKPPPAVPVDVEVYKLKREPTGTRVRAPSGYRMDQKWRAVFVTRAGAELPDGECTIVAWSYRELECTTTRVPEQLVERHETMHLRMTPPPDLVERVERERASWHDPGPPPPGWPGYKPPREKPPP